MEAISFNELPQAVGKLANQMNRIEALLTGSAQAKPKDTSNNKYTLPQAAAYCGMAEPTFRTYIYRRKVAGTKFGKAWLFLEKDLDTFIRDYRKPTAKELEKEAFEKLTNQRRA